MEIYIPIIIIPILFIAVLVFLHFTGKKTFHPGYLTSVLISFLLMLMLKSCSQYSLTKDDEYLSYHYTEVRYYEDWDEWITKTCTRSCCCDSKGENCGTETYDCSYRDYHPEYWTAILNNGHEIRISEELYLYHKARYHKSVFNDMHRDYYTDDGNMYSSRWKGDMNGFTEYTTIASYENKVQASQDVFNYPDFTEETLKELDLFEYPSKSGINMPTILTKDGIIIPDSTQMKYNYINGMLGMQKQVRLWVMVIKDRPGFFGSDQETYWKGGNKNEINIIVNVDGRNKIKGCRVFSWCENQAFKRELKDFFPKDSGLNLDKLNKKIYNKILIGFNRKQFKDFDYLQVDVPLWADILALILVILTCLGVYYFVENQRVNNVYKNRW